IEDGKPSLSLLSLRRNNFGATMIHKPINNAFYEIGYDLTVNRMYLRIKGFWKNVADVPDYIQDIDAISSKLQQGYTLVTDLRQMKTPPLEINKVHQEAQIVANKNGLSHTAEILPEQDIVLAHVVNNIASSSGMQKREFATMRKAEEWLDSLSI
ncbi:MAG: hypothetical protein AAFO69_18930, partial [Bacteroidota bacterium]